MRVKLTTCGGACGQRAEIAINGMAAGSAAYDTVFLHPDRRGVS